MSENGEFNIYIGLGQGCSSTVSNQVRQCCLRLNDHKIEGLKAHIVQPQDESFSSSHFIVFINSGQVRLTNDEQSFDIKLQSEHEVSDLLYALIAPWFLPNLVGNDYVDQKHCLELGDRVEFDVIDLSEHQSIESVWPHNQVASKPSAICCYVEPSEADRDFYAIERISSGLLSKVETNGPVILTLSADAIPKTKVYLTRIIKEVI